jgi:hypothetical protein
MKIPVFVSGPTALSPEQVSARQVLMDFLEELNLEPRALGRTDYPSELPLREVLVIARHCAGGMILGFEQFQASAGIFKRGTGDEGGERSLAAGQTAAFPTPWNHLEAGILFGLGLPLLIFREPQISGGVFDNGVTDVFIHKMPSHALSPKERSNLKEVLLKWYAKVSAHYYKV